MCSMFQLCKKFVLIRNIHFESLWSVYDLCPSKNVQCGLYEATVSQVSTIQNKGVTHNKVLYKIRFTNIQRNKQFLLYGKYS